MPETMHFKEFYRLVRKSRGLNPSHISLYLAICQKWRNEGFKGKFYISRSEMMAVSKIGSITTYHKCIKELERLELIKYEPSYHPQLGSAVTLKHLGQLE